MLKENPTLLLLIIFSSNQITTSLKVVLNFRINVLKYRAKMISGLGILTKKNKEGKQK